MGNKTFLRIAETADARELARLSAELGYAMAPTEMSRNLAALLASPSHFVTVACDDDRLLGWVAAEYRLSLEGGEKAELTGLVVDASARRRGIGRMLVAAAEQWASQRGLGKIVVRSNVAREESHPFYEGLGYTRTKTAHVYAKDLARGQEVTQ